MIKRRGKLGLIKVKTDYSGAKQWILERLGKDQQIGRANGKLKNFIIEPFIPHKDVCILFNNLYIFIIFMNGSQQNLLF